ncbi:MAG TPA: type II secretion system major pseudopilin GspG [Tepidisphaeraceae bacterium]|jgi:general secretion pathway protein G
MKNYSPQISRAARRGGSAFTLIELLLVLIILAVLAAVVVPKFTGRTEETRQKAAKAEISTIKTQLSAFEIDTGRFPTSEEGLQALIDKPADLAGWKHSYLDKLPVDPWGHPYIYRCPGNGGKDFDLLSGGLDGHEGGSDDID